LTNQQ
ncbi:hypothetical protein CPC197_0009B, partial [Chlamydia psittaci C1/97]